MNQVEINSENTNRKKPSLRLNAISNWMVLGLNIAAGFFLTPFIIRYLGESGYGIWTLVCSFIGYYGLLNMGVGSAIHRFIARDSARQDAQSLHRVASTAMAVFIVTGLLVLLFSFLLGARLADFFHVTPENREGFIHLVWLVGLTTAIGFPVEVLAAVVVAREHYVALNIANTLRILVRTGLTVLLLKLNQGLIGVGLAPLAAALVFAAVACYLFRKYAPDICFSVKNVHRPTLRKLITYGGVTTIITMASLLRTELDSVVIGRMIGLTEVGYYGIAAMILRYLFRIIGSMTQILSPRFASLDGAQQHQALKKLFLRSCGISSLLTFFICIQAYLFGERFIDLWVGPEYAVAVPILHILLICWSAGLCQNPGVSLMFALNRHKFYALVMMAEAFANVALSIMLARRFGLIGVAVGTLVPMLLAKVLVQPVLVSRIAGVGLIRYVRAILPGVLVAVVMVAAIHLLQLPAYLRNCALSRAIWIAIGSVSITGGICMACWILMENKARHESC